MKKTLYSDFSYLSLNQNELQILEDLRQYDKLKKKLCQRATEILSGGFNAKITDIHIRRDNTLSFRDKNGALDIPFELYLKEDWKVYKDIIKNYTEYLNNPSIQVKLKEVEELKWAKIEEANQLDPEKIKEINDFLNSI
jgi:hypothetical protein